MRVLIIGAGVGGLSAAVKLRAMGIDVLILEGRDRIGGRICKSEEFHDIPIDLGASWIHGVTENPLAAIADKLKLRLDVTHNPDLTGDADSFEVFDEDGTHFDEETQQKMRKKFDEMTKEGRQFMDALGKDLPLETVLALDDLDHSRLSKKEIRFFNWLKSGIEGWDNTDLSNLSARGHYWENENNFDGGDGFVIDGFFNLVNELAQELVQEKRILLNHGVQKIEYGYDSVRAHTKHGIFHGDYVICTVPLGVLKAQTIEFSPPLPPWKKTSIDKLGFGLMNKIVIEFPHRFWKENLEGLGYVSDQKGEFNFFLNMYPLTKRPILMGFVAADFAHLIENWTDEMVIEKIMGILRRIYAPRGETVPEPYRFKITRWGKDPHSLGSYSFLAFGSGLQDIDRIALRLGRLHFAGEATFKPLGFTHGAFLSGIREADRILGSIRANNSQQIRTQATPHTPISLPSSHQQLQLAKL